MSEDITPVIEGLLSKNRGPDGNQPDYGIRALIESGKTPRIEIVLTFKKNSLYCCTEPGCHLGVGPAFWAKLRARLKDSGIAESRYPMTLRVQGIVQQGALMTLGTIAPLVCDAQEYSEDYAEIGGGPATQSDPHC
jgi:hypothetical protein